MLSGLLKNDIAIEINVKIINAFVAMRHYIGNNLLNQKYYNDMTIRHDSEIKMLQESFDKLEENSKNQKPKEWFYEHFDNANGKYYSANIISLCSLTARNGYEVIFQLQQH
jgi:hypothetical protein